MDKIILHCDINNFYASVEMLLNPELQNKSIAVCGDPTLRHGIVLAKNNLAKAHGVKTGMAIWEAKQKSPDIIVVAPTYNKYTFYSREVYDVYTEFTPQVESFGLDECWLDVTGCVGLFGDGETIAYKIKERIKQKTGLTISVGVSFTKVFAKLGSDLKKPDAVTVISRENYRKICWDLPSSELLYVGHKLNEKLMQYNIVTIGDIAKSSPALLNKLLGKSGDKIFNYANGIETEEVKCYTSIHIPESIGNGTTTSQDITNIDDATSVIFSLCEMIAFRLRKYCMQACGVSISLRNNLLTTFTRQSKLGFSTNNALDIAKKAINLLSSNYNFQNMPPLRTITIGTYGLVKEGELIQTSIFDNAINQSSKLDTSIDKIRAKYGYCVIKRCITLGTIFNSDYKDAEEFLPFDKNNKNISKN